MKRSKKVEGACPNRAKRGGFTLIEILVVIGLIAILATVVLIAINPARQFAQANDSQRTANINSILNAIGQYAADNKGDLPGDIEGMTDDTEESLASTDVDVCADLVPDYMPALPRDPDNGEPVAEDDCDDAYDTGYTILKDSNGRITITAVSEVDGTDISVTR